MACLASAKGKGKGGGVGEKNGREGTRPAPFALATQAGIGSRTHVSLLKIKNKKG